MSWAGLRAAALVAALVLALLSRGDVIVVAGVLALVGWRPLPAVAVAAALKATAWRWSSTSLEHVAGAQSVLGPAGLVDPPSAAASAWCAAAAIVLVAPSLRITGRVERSPRRAAAPPDDAAGEDRAEPVGSPRADLVDGGRVAVVVARWLPRVVAAVVAGLLVAGPAADRDGWIRAVGALGAFAAVVLLDRLLPRRRMPREIAGALAGVASFVLVAVDAPPVDGVLDAAALREGLAVAVAVGVLAWSAGAAWVHARRRRPHPGPHPA